MVVAPGSEGGQGAWLAVPRGRSRSKSVTVPGWLQAAGALQLGSGHTQRDCRNFAPSAPSAGVAPVCASELVCRALRSRELLGPVTPGRSQQSICSSAPRAAGRGQRAQRPPQRAGGRRFRAQVARIHAPRDLGPGSRAALGVLRPRPGRGPGGGARQQRWARLLMGCGPSSPSAPGDAAGPRLVLPPQLVSMLPRTGPLRLEDFKARLQAVKGQQEIASPDGKWKLTLSYAFVSQRGYYPETPHKANQDAVIAIKNFGNSSSQFFCGVFDGHGHAGAACSQFTKTKVPDLLQKDEAFAGSPAEALMHAMLETNVQLHESPIDDLMSGTTAIACLLRKRLLFVANVGDSRAVLARQGPEGRLQAEPLSIDHTPFREDECERVRRHGGRVMTLDQIEGIKDPTVRCWASEEEDGGDPPRVWAPEATYPGTAFTRSIGDQEAEVLGVVAQPEVAVCELGADTPYILLASDGVFEFLSSQGAVDLVAKHKDPQAAALALVVASYKLWLQYETRTDDITAVVIKVDLSLPEEGKGGALAGAKPLGGLKAPPPGGSQGEGDLKAVRAEDSDLKPPPL